MEAQILFLILACFVIQSYYCQELNQEKIKKTCTYVIYVQTGDVDGGGTQAQVSLVLRDKYANELNITNLAKWGLKGGQWYDYFERSNLDVFVSQTRCLQGPVCSITLSHDNSGFFPNWYVDYVYVSTNAPHISCSKLKFPVNSWLAFNKPPYYSTRRGVYLCDEFASGVDNV